MDEQNSPRSFLPTSFLPFPRSSFFSVHFNALGGWLRARPSDVTVLSPCDAYVRFFPFSLRTFFGLFHRYRLSTISFFSLPVNQFPKARFYFFPSIAPAFFSFL